MIIEALIGVCFFAGVVVILSVPWLARVDHLAELPPEHPEQH